MRARYFPEVFYWASALAVLLVLALGWRYPYLGYIVPLSMFAGILGGVFKGRWVCGNLCPRGAFFDKFAAKICKARRPLPEFLRNFKFRWVLFPLLMAFMFYRASADFTSAAHWGHVFWLMCLITTIVGLIGGLFFNSRFWCGICPVGTFGATFSRQKDCLQIDKKACINCQRCAKRCPMLLDPAAHSGAIAQRDCLHCAECAAACPKQAICRAKTG